MNEFNTLFSKEEFVQTWVTHSNVNSRVMTLSLGESSARGVMHGIVKSRGGSIKAEFGPQGLFACPAPFSFECRSLRKHLLMELRKQRVAKLMWHVRFDHESLALRLQDAGFSSEPYWTHALSLEKPYEEIFAGYHATRRNQIRKCYRRGVTIREAGSREDIAAYCLVHERLAGQKPGFKLKYPFELIYGLYQLKKHTTVLVAEIEGRVIAGALFFADGDSMFYWHGAADREYADLFPTGALLDRGIQIAMQKQLKSFNFGASNSDSLRDFKKSFGSEPRQNWTFCIEPKRSLAWRITSKIRRSLALNRVNDV
jgi:lipid II:glycine glycyltransferase (peptidoglycan interpeptide bridge formation enzyme)